MTLTEIIVSMCVLSLFTASALGYLSASRDMAARLERDVCENDLLRCSADALERDLSCTGCGVPLEGDAFAPIVIELASGPDGGTSAVTMYSNPSGRRIPLAHPVRAGERTLFATEASLARGDRILLRSANGWEIGRVDRVWTQAGEKAIALRDPVNRDCDSVSAISIVQYSLDRKKRTLYRSENGGNRQPLIEGCTSFSVEARNRLTGEPISGTLSLEGLLAAEASFEFTVNGSITRRRFPFLLQWLDSRFFALPATRRGAELAASPQG